MNYQLPSIIWGFLFLVLSAASSAIASPIKPDQTPSDLPAAIEQAALQEKILLSQGQTFLDVGQYKQSMAIANRLLRTNPNLAAAWLLLGNSLSKLDRSEEALIAYDQALKLNQARPQKPNEIAILWGERARVLDKMSRYQEAVAAYDQALKIRCAEQAQRVNEPLPPVCEAYASTNPFPRNPQPVIPVEINKAPVPSPKPDSPTIW